MKKINLFILAFFALYNLTPVVTAAAHQDSSPVVHAVFFYKPTCPYCHEVNDNTLLPLMEQYGDELEIMAVNNATPEGQALYEAFVAMFDVPGDRQGVPTILIGDTVLVGAVEIPAEIPNIVANGRLAGGIGWNVPAELAAVLEADNPQAASNGAVEPLTASTLALPGEAEGAWLAQSVMLGLVVAIGFAVVRAAPKLGLLTNGQPPRVALTPVWLLPALVVGGIAVAGYLTYVGLTATEAVCGLGDCNTVQSSIYARVFGIPIALLGLLAYAAMGALWFVQRNGDEVASSRAYLGMLALATGGTLVSIYLTFLEVSVLKAICLWCVASAAIMGLSLAALAGPLAEMRVRRGRRSLQAR
jgi:uncharacterized membrane protein